MPNRCGIIHVRGPIPPNRISHREGEPQFHTCYCHWFRCKRSSPCLTSIFFVVGDWQKTFEEKLASLFGVKETLSEDEAAKMGRKDPEQEVEKFVLANTQELGKDKWLCPLSGKKFKVCDETHCCVKHLINILATIAKRILNISISKKLKDSVSPQGPEFVRKHILNKHGDKIEEVKKEVVFFNNFLMDAKRPSIPEMKPPPPPGPGQGKTPVNHFELSMKLNTKMSSKLCQRLSLIFRSAFTWSSSIPTPGSSRSYGFWPAPTSSHGLRRCVFACVVVDRAGNQRAMMQMGNCFKHKVSNAKQYFAIKIRS